MLASLASVGLSFGQELNGGVPFFNDAGKLTLPEQSVEELQESMPELGDFPATPRALMPPCCGTSTRT